jgi:manganese oxidase
MFTVVKVREDLMPNDYKDPGPYKFPQGTVAYAVDAGAAGEAMRQPDVPETRGMELPMQQGDHPDHH